MEDSAPVLSKVAQDVNKYAKCVTVVSSVMQVIVITSNFVEMDKEIKLGIKEWPDIHIRVLILSEAMLREQLQSCIQTGM